MTYLVILDPGHGLDTSGKRTPFFPDGTFMKENEFNRSVVRKIDSMLELHENIDVVFTTTEKRDISLEERVSRVNALYEKVKNLYDKVVLVSVHANALTGAWGSQNGTETYYYPTNPVDKKFAETVHKHLVQATSLRDRGVIAEEFYIIKNVKMTACLCECAFMDNINEAKLLMADEFRQACAEGITNGILDYLGINQKKEADEMKTEFKEYSNGMTEMKNHPSKLTNDIVNKRIWDITEFTNCVNGTFFYPDGKGGLYSTSILYKNGITYQDTANHYWNFGTPQSVFIVYKDNTVDLERIKFLSELDLSKIKLAIGGVGLRNTQDSKFYYSPVAEGFKAGYNLKGEWKDFTDVLKKRNKTVLGYNKKLNKCYLLTVPSISHGELIRLISIGDESYDIAISLDGGGSTFMDANGKYVFEGENSRRIHNIMRFL